MLTFRKSREGWAAFGPADEVQVGPVEIHRKDGQVIRRTVTAVSRPFADNRTGEKMAYGYLADERGEVVRPAAPAEEAHTRRFPLTAEQREIVDRFVAGETFKVQAYAGAGKALRSDQPVLTPDGWRAIGTLAIGDYVIGSDGSPHAVTGVFPQGTVPLVEIEFTGGTKVVASLDHLWSCQTKYERDQHRGWTVRSTAEIVALLADPKTRSVWMPMLSAPVGGHTERLPVHPWLLGAIIGDGNISGAGIGFSNPDPLVLARVDALLPSGVYRDPSGSGEGDGKDWRLTCRGATVKGRRGYYNPLTVALDELGMRGRCASEKVVPDCYMTASAPVRLALLQGLMDTDGYADGHTCEWGTTSPQLAQQVAYLVESFGGIATVATKMPTYTHNGEKRTGQLFYRMHVRLPEHVRPFAHSAKAARYTPRTKYQPARRIVNVAPMADAEAVCISVDAPDRLYLTAGCIPTHNTSTLRDMAEAVRGEGRKGRYLAFNRPIVLEAMGKMPRNVAVSTAHAMALDHTPEPFRARFRAPREKSLSGPRMYLELARRLGLHEPMRFEVAPGRVIERRPGKLAGDVLRAVRKFCQSGDAEIGRQHFEVVEAIEMPGDTFGSNSVKLREALLPVAQRAWADLCDPDGRLIPYGHEHYLKQFQLRGVVLDVDFVLVDEAQDLSPVLLAIVERQIEAGKQVALVGDTFQSIYAFSGAVNAMELAPISTQLYLTKSFRFGPAIAATANRVLDYLGAEVPLVGNEAIADYVGPGEGFCVLTRSNAAAVRRLLDEIKAQGKPLLIGSAEEIRSFVKAARDLIEGRRTEHPELHWADSWADVQEHAGTDEGEDLRLWVDMIDDFGVEPIERALDAMPKDEREATRVISTAHKVKGLEWESVELHAGLGYCNEQRPLEPEAARLLYVAVTRAQRALDISSVAFFRRHP